MLKSLPFGIYRVRNKASKRSFLSLYFFLHLGQWDRGVRMKNNSKEPQPSHSGNLFLSFADLHFGAPLFLSSEFFHFELRLCVRVCCGLGPAKQLLVSLASTKVMFETLCDPRRMPSPGSKLGAMATLPSQWASPGSTTMRRVSPRGTGHFPGLGIGEAGPAMKDRKRPPMQGQKGRHHCSIAPGLGNAHRKYSSEFGTTPPGGAVACASHRPDSVL